jgi:hypothetical protein
MEDLWKKFKEETREDVLKINEFLNLDKESEDDTLDETSLNETFSQFCEEVRSLISDVKLIKDEKSQRIKPIVENSTNETSIKQNTSNNSIISDRSSRKDVYGKMRNLVRDIMEKDHLSRAQAYRKAKKLTESV